MNCIFQAKFEIGIGFFFFMNSIFVAIFPSRDVQIPLACVEPLNWLKFKAIIEITWF